MKYRVHTKLDVVMNKDFSRVLKMIPIRSFSTFRLFSVDEKFPLHTSLSSIFSVHSEEFLYRYTTGGYRIFSPESTCISLSANKE